MNLFIETGLSLLLWFLIKTLYLQLNCTHSCLCSPFFHCFSPHTLCTLCWYHTCLSLQTSLSSGWSNTRGLRGVPENRHNPHRTGHAQPFFLSLINPPQKNPNPQLSPLFISPHPQINTSWPPLTFSLHLWMHWYLWVFLLLYWWSIKLWQLWEEGGTCLKPKQNILIICMFSCVDEQIQPPSVHFPIDFQWFPRFLVTNEMHFLLQNGG